MLSGRAVRPTADPRLLPTRLALSPYRSMLEGIVNRRSTLELVPGGTAGGDAVELQQVSAQVLGLRVEEAPTRLQLRAVGPIAVVRRDVVTPDRR